MNSSLVVCQTTGLLFVRAIDLTSKSAKFTSCTNPPFPQHFPNNERPVNEFQIKLHFRLNNDWRHASSEDCFQIGLKYCLKAQKSGMK